MTLEEKLGYVMLGYEKAIAALMELDFKSETIQKLVNLIYQLQCDGSADHKYFAEKQMEMMANREKEYLEMFNAEEYDYLLNAVKFFGNKGETL